MKYIIDVPDDRIGDFVGSTHLLMSYIMAGHKGHHDTGLNLTPYTEPDRKAIDLQHAHDIENVARMNYSKGAEDAWEFVNTLYGLSDEELYEIFDDGNYCEHSYQEAKAKYEAWKKQKDEIRVGDEVLPMDTQYDTMIVTRTWKDDYWKECIDTVGFDGSICSFLQSEVKKTGRHFDAVEELLSKISEESE